MKKTQQFPVFFKPPRCDWLSIIPYILRRFQCSARRTEQTMPVRQKSFFVRRTAAIDYILPAGMKIFTSSDHHELNDNPFTVIASMKGRR